MEDLLQKLRDENATVATAESCTGGLIAAALTESAGSSRLFRGSIVAYHEDLKHSFLGVPKALLEKHGAVNAEVAEIMATAIRRDMRATYGISSTGFAGPSGGTTNDPVGTVYLGIASQDRVESYRFVFEGSRHDVRTQAVLSALKVMNRFLN